MTKHIFEIGVLSFLVLTLLFIFTAYENEEKANVLSQTVQEETVFLQAEYSYILNVKSKKIHKHDCGSAGLMNNENKWEFFGEIESLYDDGYTMCGNCFK